MRRKKGINQKDYHFFPEEKWLSYIFWGTKQVVEKMDLPSSRALSFSQSKTSIFKDENSAEETQNTEVIENENSKQM